MASRWAFEASMVAQFKDNRFEKEFYELEKTVAEADYKKVYYIPTLQSKLDYANQNYSRPEADKVKVQESFNILQNEINQVLQIIGKHQFLEVALLQPATFDSAVYHKTRTFLLQLKQFYTNQATVAVKEREKKMHAMRDLLGGEKEYEKFRQSYQNEAIAVLVKNQDEPQRIIESRGRLIQKIYPIYKDPDPDHLIDFDAQFYLPAKHFLRNSIDTFYFNLAVIWTMSIILYVLLYFDVLRRFLKRLENIS
jgi:ABC transport system ATP-binding/permease protein